MANKARHAFGNSANVESAKNTGKIDDFDILFLDGDTEPKIGWIDKNGVTRIVDTSKQVVTVTELPVADGDEGVIYIYNHEAYVWDGTQCVAVKTDVSAIETDVENLKTAMDTKVDEDTLDTKIQEKVDEAVSEAEIEVVEF